MSEFTPKAVCVLGRQPALGLAELESLYGAEHIKPFGDDFAVLDIEAGEINFKRLGGTIKTARILSTLPHTNWEKISQYLREKIPEHLKYMPEGKFTLGVSAYNLPVKAAWLNKNNLEIKKRIKASGRPVRIVPNKTEALNSAQVLHNKLTHLGAWELVLIGDGKQTILAQTMFVQDIDAYAARDQARPKRDARAGMLPPKLAQIIVNLSVGPLEKKLQSDARLSGAQGEDEQRSEAYEEYGERVAQSSTQRSAKTGGGATGSASRQTDRSRIRVLDPFCGTGVILQEAMLMGYSVIGSDIEPRMVDYTRQNLQWLVSKQPQLENYTDIEVGDATSHTWSGFSAVASEVYLGRPLAALPKEAGLKQIISDANTITKKFLMNISAQMKPGQRLCLAVPAWQTGPEKFLHLPLLDKITDMGYNYLDLKHVGRNQLLYYRANQLVARQLVILEKA